MGPPASYSTLPTFIGSLAQRARILSLPSRGSSESTWFVPSLFTVVTRPPTAKQAVRTDSVQSSTSIDECPLARAPGNKSVDGPAPMEGGFHLGERRMSSSFLPVLLPAYAHTKRRCCRTTT